MKKAKGVTRRALLQTSAASACVLAVGGTCAYGDQAGAKGAAPESGSSDGAGDGIRYGFLVGLSRCVGCGRCVEACRKYNNLSDDTPDRRRVLHFEGSTGKNYFLSTSCMHCADPSCLRVCPAGAISKNSMGVVLVNKDRCIGCKYCYQACPYEVPRYNATAMDKCDCCLGAGVSAGEIPYCVRACKFGALTFGPIDELMDSTNGSAVPIAEENDPSCLLLGVRR